MVESHNSGIFSVELNLLEVYFDIFGFYMRSHCCIKLLENLCFSAYPAVYLF